MTQTLIALLVAFGFSFATLKYDVPAGWISKKPTSSMRVADFDLPKVAGDTEDATTTIFFFGAQQGGSVQANMDRWIGQLSQPDGKPSKGVAKTSTLTSHGLKVSIVDVSGTYVVETPGGNYYVKLTGPAKTVGKWEPSYMALLKSLRFE